MSEAPGSPGQLPAPGLSRLGALMNRDYRLFVFGNAVSLIGSWTQRVAAGWLVWEMTGSPTWLGLIAFADLIPVLLFSPLSGPITDRYPRQKLLRAVQVIAILPALATAALSFAGLLNEWLLLAFAFGLGSAQAIEQSSRLAFVADIVERRDLTSAVAINSVTFNLACFAGPAFAGALIALADASWAFAFNAASFAALLWALSAMRPIAGPEWRSDGASVLGDLTQGLAYIRRTEGLCLILVLIGALNFGARPILELLPAFSERHFSAGSTGFAVLSSAVGAGAMAGGLVLAFARGPRSNTRDALVSALGVIVTGQLFLLPGQLWLGVLVIFNLGIFLATSGIAMQSILQLHADPAYRGRVLAIYGLLFRAAPALGGLAMGALSEVTGLRLPAILGGLIILAALTSVSFRRAAILRMEAS